MTTHQNLISRVYFEALCCACVFAGLPNFVEDAEGRRFYTSEIIKNLPAWFACKNIPKQLRLWFVKNYTVPTARELLAKGGFDVPGNPHLLFEQLTAKQLDYLQIEFARLKNTGNDFRNFTRGAEQDEARPGLFRRFRQFLARA